MMPFQWPGAWFPEFSCETHVLSPVITRVHKLVISSEVHFLYPRLFITIFMKKDPWNFNNKKCANCQEMFVLLNLFINFNFCFESFSAREGWPEHFSLWTLDFPPLNKIHYLLPDPSPITLWPCTSIICLSILIGWYFFSSKSISHHQSHTLQDFLYCHTFQRHTKIHNILNALLPGQDWASRRESSMTWQQWRGLYVVYQGQTSFTFWTTLYFYDAIILIISILL